MIESFADPEAEKIFKGVVSMKLPLTIQKTARRKLVYLDDADDLRDLFAPPGNRLALYGDREGQYGLRINNPYRVCFKWEKGKARDVEIVDQPNKRRDMDRLAPIHPGEVLLEDFIKPFGLSQYRVAKDIGVPALRISQIVRGRRSITADTALRLARYFGTSAAVWLRLQARYDLEVAEAKTAKRINREVKVLQPSAVSS